MANPLLKVIGSKDASNVSAPVSGHVPATEFSGNAAIVTLGCAKNTVDSEVMLGALVKRGYRLVNELKEAEIIIVNTCAFLESAVAEGVDRILEISDLKKSARLKKLLVAGCMVERYKGELKESLPEVDGFISTDELLDVSLESETSKECFDEARRPYFLYDESMPRVLSSAAHSVYIKISEGCNRPCTFCIIPKLRGGLRSRRTESIFTEAKELISGGAKELNLIAQDLTAYGSDFEDSKSNKNKSSAPLINLIDSLGQLKQFSSDNNFWLRLFYAYPVGTNKELLDKIRESAHVCNYLDMPLQHIASSVLKSMRRPLGGKGTKALIEQISRDYPEIKLRTTFITGFPGETRSDVEELKQFILEGHFAHVGVFTYSDEKEAGSFDYENKVPKDEAIARKDELLEAQTSIIDKHLESYIGKEVEVLIDGTHPETELLMSARCNWQGPEVDGSVLINDFSDKCLNESGLLDHESLKGKFAKVQITERAGADLVGKLNL